MKVSFSNTTPHLPQLKAVRSSGESSLGVPALNPVQLRQLSNRQELLRHPRDIFDENSKNYNPESPLARHAVIPPQQMTLPQLNARLLEAKELKARTESNLKDYDSIDKKFDDFLTGKQNVLPITYTRTLDELGPTAITMDLAKRSFERIIEKLDLVVAELNREIKKREKR